jgi:uncharacterized membrane protein
MSVVVYGFLAFLICREQRSGIRNLIALTVTFFVALIAFSRLYLGAHWASDVIAGMSFGLAWIGLLAMAYTCVPHKSVKPKQFSWLLITILLLSSSWHMMQNHSQDSLRYSPAPYESSRIADPR